MKKFKKVAVGGTFDELHRGHKALLNKAFEVGEKVVIGLSSDEFVAKMGKPHVTASFDERFRELECFLDKSDLSGRSEIVPLNDPYGLTISGKGFDALVVSQETIENGDIINKMRSTEGVQPLKIIVVNMVQSRQQGFEKEKLTEMVT
jgi:pantetheine-phosphate adenylyltransferase